MVVQVRWTSGGCLVATDTGKHRGPNYRALAPPPGPDAVTLLPAGETVMIEIACRELLAWRGGLRGLTLAPKRHCVDLNGLGYNSSR